MFIYNLAYNSRASDFYEIIVLLKTGYYVFFNSQLNFNFLYFILFHCTWLVRPTTDFEWKALHFLFLSHSNLEPS